MGGWSSLLVDFAVFCVTNLREEGERSVCSAEERMTEIEVRMPLAAQLSDDIDLHRSSHATTSLRAAAAAAAAAASQVAIQDHSHVSSSDDLDMPPVPYINGASRLVEEAHCCCSSSSCSSWVHAHWPPTSFSNMVRVSQISHRQTQNMNPLLVLQQQSECCFLTCLLMGLFDLLQASY